MPSGGAAFAQQLEHLDARPVLTLALRLEGDVATVDRTTGCDGSSTSTAATALSCCRSDRRFALLPDDRALSDTMLAAARATLGDDAFGAEIAAGRALELPDVLLAADEVFDEALRTP